MKLIETALQIALRAYAGKTDKAGRAYILHPLRVMAKMNTDLERSAALLAARDVLEDSDITAGELLAEGIPAEVVEAIQYLSKDEGEEYQNFVARAKRNKIAAKVKMADFEDNIDVLRLSSLDEWDLARIKRYHTAWRLLQEESE